MEKRVQTGTSCVTKPQWQVKGAEHYFGLKRDTGIFSFTNGHDESEWELSN